MKILILGSNKKFLCGWTTMSFGLLEGFSKHKIKSFVLEGINPYKKIKNPLHLSYHIKNSKLSFVLDVIRIFLFAIIYKPDHILIIPERLCEPTFFVSRILPVKYSIYCAGTYSSILLEKSGKFSKKAFDSAKNIFPMSNYTKKRIKQFSQNKRIYTVYSGYNDNKYFFRNLEKEKFSIIFVGNLKKRKGLKVLCNAIFNLPLDIQENIKIRLVGQFNPKEFIQFSQLFQEHKIKYKVYSNISDEELSILFNKSTVNVLPSITENYYYEGFGIVHSEAIASNCISIGSLDSGNECAIKNKNGYLVKQGNGAAKDLSEILYKIFTSSRVELPRGQKPLKWSDVTAKILSKI